jgi:hypothetical protein
VLHVSTYHAAADKFAVARWVFEKESEVFRDAHFVSVMELTYGVTRGRITVRPLRRTASLASNCFYVARSSSGDLGV